MIKHRCIICSNEFERKNKSKIDKCKKCYNKGYAREYAKRQRKKNKDKYKRQCPKCNKEISYSSTQMYEKAVNKKSICLSCSGRERMQKINLEIEQGLRKNGFFGKHHSVETIKFLKGRDTSYTQTEDFREKQSIANSGEKNNMYGKTVYGVWVEKYGQEVADHKMIEYKKKQSILNSGENNSMYGKPSPQGSGNGWSGWYKGWFFRSIGELSYMVSIIDNKKLKWESGEKKKYKISYIDYAGQKRNYFPDFVIEKKYMVECKPKKLHTSPKTLAKKMAAEKFCKKNNLIYKLRDVKKLSTQKIIELVNNKEIKFTEKYLSKFLEYIKTNNYLI